MGVFQMIDQDALLGAPTVLIEALILPEVDPIEQSWIEPLPPFSDTVGEGQVAVVRNTRLWSRLVAVK
jgi:hypothetical protein